MLKGIIVDDEKRSRELLFRLITDFCHEVEIKASAANVQEALLAIKEHQPNVVFLDIEMPEEDGFELFNYLDEINFDVIFTTAYDNYAVRAFEFAAADYLLKPIHVERLVKAVKRVQKKEIAKLDKTQVKVLRSNLNFPIQKLAIPTEKGFQVIEINKINRCSASRNYTQLFMDSGEKLLVSKTLAKFEALLKEFDFLRVHRSHLININKITGFIKGKAPILIMNDGAKVDVSPNRKEVVLKYWNFLK